MKLETFFKHFDLLAEAPNGVQKLRELILDLAVRGKLVPQDANDEPAAVLLERIKKEKERLVKEGKVTKSKPLPEITPDEIPYDLPKNWEWVRFGNIAQHNAGKTKDRGRNIGKLRDYITTSNLYWGYFDFNNVRQMPFKDEELEKCTAKKGDLLICEGGEAGRAAVWDLDKDICFQNHIHRARFYCDISQYYAYRFFEKLNANGEIEQYRKGVGISSMSGKILSLIFFPLPPLNEQKRIVTKVDELMKLCDELEARQKKKQETRILINNAALNKLLTAETPETFTKNWQRISDNFDILYSAPENIGKLRQAILQLAVMGKLVPQDANDEPAAVLLERIKKEKERLVKEGKVKKEKSLPEIKDNDIPFELPQGWECCYISELAIKVTDGEHITPTRTPSGHYLLSARNIKEEGIILDNVDYVPESEFSRIRKRCNPDKDDILISCSGSVGRIAIVDKDDTYVMVRSVALLKLFKDNINSKYLAYILKSLMVQNQIIEKSKTSAQANLFLGKIKEIKVVLAPLNEQKRIVTKVDKLMKLCDELETKLTQTQTEREKIINAAVKQLLTV
jgi:type I restriction enzyme S subunit